MGWAEKLADALNGDEEFRVFALASVLFLERYYRDKGGAGEMIEERSRIIIDMMNKMLDDERKRRTPDLVSSCLIFEALLAGLAGVLELIEEDNDFNEIAGLMKRIAQEEKRRFEIHYG